MFDLLGPFVIRPVSGPRVMVIGVSWAQEYAWDGIP